jgi:putative ABC transport system substrate-binding protein
MDRRTFVAGILALFAVPLAAEAQEAGKVYRIGILWPGASPPPGSRLDWFREGLRESGYVEGQNVAIELRYSERGERLHDFATELARLNVSVIMAFGDLAPQMAQRATTTIPIVALTDDFVGTGLATSLARPSGNTTGVTILSPELNAKRLGLLKEIVHKVSRVAVLWDPATPTQLRAIDEAARSLGVKLQVLEVRGGGDLAGAFQAAKKQRAQALDVSSSPLIASLFRPIIDLAAANRIPVTYQWKEHAQAGGLVSYRPSLAAMWRQTAVVAGKILKGAKPVDLPIEQPTRFELVINLNEWAT